MCFALLALGQHSNYPFILAANRDEFFARPALAMHEWEDAEGVLAGRDMESRGSWLALNKRDKRFALVTNVRDGTPQAAERSRGLLITDLVDTTEAVETCLATLEGEQQRYAGFNVLAGTIGIGEQAYYLTNRDQAGAEALAAGVYGLSNARLDTPWPKVVKGKRRLSELLQGEQVITAEALFAILADNEIAADKLLPETGVSLEIERWLSSTFIRVEHYGTRCSTVIFMDRNGVINVYERSFYPEKCFNDVAYQF